MDGQLEQMAACLRGGREAPRVWRDRFRCAGAASLKPDFVPEDVYDQQPLVEEEGVFVCQARIDNRGTLHQRLGLRQGQPMADSELLAAAYARWGNRCVEQVVGDFAFAAWHRADGRVVAAVDHLGTRRLYWAAVGTGIALCSQLAPLLGHPAISHAPDLDAMARLFYMGVDRTSTPFSSIRAVPGGHLLTWRPGAAPRLARWWQPDSEPTVWHRDPRDYVSETRELLGQAVRAQLRSSGPLCTMLSGGLDSGCVTATAAGLLAEHNAGITAYTSVPEPGLTPSQRPGWEPDDRGYAAATVARHANIGHRLVSPGGRCVLDVLPSIHAVARTPTKTTSNFLWADAISTSTAASGSSVLLIGQHGNAAFSWKGEGHLWELLAHGHLRGALAQAALDARVGDTHLTRVMARAVRAGLRSTVRPRSLGNGARPPGLVLLHPERRSALAPPSGLYAEAQGSRAAWVAFATTARHVWSPEPVAQWGIEWRDPTADRRLVERLLQFPQAAFRVAGRERGLARSVAEGLLPEHVRLRRTQGAQLPEAPSLIALNATRYEAALAEMRGCAGCRELLDLESLRRSLERLVGGAQDYLLALAVDRAFDVGLFLVSLERPA